MAFLIIKERGENGSVLIAVRHARRAATYETIRAAITKLFPTRTICSPLDTCKAGATQLIVYVSDDPDGFGRIGGCFDEWAVNP